jgi:hypothetical protein
MKAEELRLGNLVSNMNPRHNDSILTIESIGDNHEVNVFYRKYLLSELEPIPLNEEWLIKFGFEFHINANCQNFYYAKDAFICIRADEDFEWFRYYNGDFYHELKYVHQLQNLYFALTGEELTLKP